MYRIIHTDNWYDETFNTVMSDNLDETKRIFFNICQRTKRHEIVRVVDEDNMVRLEFTNKL